MTMTTPSASPERNPFPVYSRGGHLVGWRWIDEVGQHSKTLYPTMLEALHSTMLYIANNDPRPVPWWKQTLRSVAGYLESVAR